MKFILRLSKYFVIYFFFPIPNQSYAMSCTFLVNVTLFCSMSKHIKQYKLIIILVIKQQQQNVKCYMVT